MSDLAPQQPLDSFLPSNATSLDALLTGFGKYWCHLPSLTSYKRYFSCDEQHLFLWEGYAGEYDSYGDFSDDDRFYNDVVKGVYLYFHISNIENKITIWGFNYAVLDALPPDVRSQAFSLARSSPRGRDPFGITFEHHFPSLNELRAAMLAQWVNWQPSLGEQGAALHAFTATHAPLVRQLFEGYATQWLTANPNGHWLIFTHDHYTYLALWLGDVDGLTIPMSGYNDGRPAVRWKVVQEYAEVRSAFKRLPIRFQLEIRQGRGQHVRYRDISGEAIKTVAELERVFNQTMADAGLWIR